jgi:pimeloyl-ACP methyl ester carboxylesterase
MLEGGRGAPILLLHGPGESAVNFRWIIPGLVDTNRVIAPDLQGHGGTGLRGERLEGKQVLDWLGELISATCTSPPVVVGHVLGGAIAARYARTERDRLAHLVLVDSLGLARFRPSPSFAFGLFRFATRPSERTYERFMKQCAFDLDRLRDRIGGEWEPFVSHNLELARSDRAKEARRLMRQLGIPRIPSRELDRIETPTTLIWGRHDRANRLGIAEAASVRHGWPLHVIDEAADDPIRDRPNDFLRALRTAIGSDAAGAA